MPEYEALESVKLREYKQALLDIFLNKQDPKTIEEMLEILSIDRDIAKKALRKYHDLPQRDTQSYS